MSVCVYVRDDIKNMMVPVFRQRPAKMANSPLSEFNALYITQPCGYQLVAILAGGRVIQPPGLPPTHFRAAGGYFRPSVDR